MQKPHWPSLFPFPIRVFPRKISPTCLWPNLPINYSSVIRAGLKTCNTDRHQRGLIHRGKECGASLQKSKCQCLSVTVVTFFCSELEASNVCLSLWSFNGSKKRTGAVSTYLRCSCAGVHDHQLNSWSSYCHSCHLYYKAKYRWQCSHYPSITWPSLATGDDTTITELWNQKLKHFKKEPCAHEHNFLLCPCLLLHCLHVGVSSLMVTLMCCV